MASSSSLLNRWSIQRLRFSAGTAGLLHGHLVVCSAPDGRWWSVLVRMLVRNVLLSCTLRLLEFVGDIPKREILRPSSAAYRSRVASVFNLTSFLSLSLSLSSSHPDTDRSARSISVDLSATPMSTFDGIVQGKSPLSRYIRESNLTCSRIPLHPK